MKKIFFLLLMSLLSAAALNATPSTPSRIPAGYSELEYSFPSWNEYDDIKIYRSTTDTYTSGSALYFDYDHRGKSDGELVIMVNPTEKATLSFLIQPWTGTHYQIPVYCDNEKCESIIMTDASRGFYLELEAGEHEIRFTIPNGYDARIDRLGMCNTKLLTVDLLEPGSLGTEILYQDVERLQDVRKLKISGTMNNDDWEKIGMMKNNLYYLDLSDAVIQSIPNNRFENWPYIHTVFLPEGLESIGSNAFYGTHIQNINFPNTLKTIGDYAFQNSEITEAIMGDETVTLGDYAFDGCRYLKNLRLSKNLKKIPSACFRSNYWLANFELPTELETIESNAFNSASRINFDLPSTLKYIGSRAFAHTNNVSESERKTELVIPNGCELSGSSIFEGTYYTSVVLPVTYYKSEYSNILPNTVTHIRLNSPTVVIKNNTPISSLTNVTLEVPNFLVNSYKLDTYWYNAKQIIGFDPGEIDEWTIRAALVLGARDRLTGTPSVIINNQGSLKINGSDAMPIDALTINTYYPYYLSDARWGQIFSNADGVTVSGDLKTNVYFDRAKKWYFISLPYDVKLSDITSLNGGQMAVRYYDGNNRATYGATGSWKNFESDEIIQAGTGFIVNTSDVGTWEFLAQNNESKQNITSNRMFVKNLEANPSEQPSNRGWNLVGNPYQCYYNIHKLNFTAPITIYDGSNYVAYSIIDDDYALRPNQAFFVQCPEGVAAISFPLDGRQMTSVITSQQGAPARNPQAKDRLITDITISAGEEYDRTRVVLNEIASSEYELTCDAAKFFADEASLQIYSIGSDDEVYAINERPTLDGIVRLGMTASESALYTISATRTDLEHIYLTDHDNGTVTDLAYTDYTFHSEAGRYDDRFTISLEAGTTIIGGIEQTAVKVAGVKGGILVSGTVPVEVYNAAGVKVADENVCGDAEIPVARGIYVVKAGKKIVKVTVL